MLLNYGAEDNFWNPLDYLEIKSVNLKGNQPWLFIGRTDAVDEAPILWLPDKKSRLIGKDPDAGQDWGQEEKGTTEVEMVGWHHQLSGHEFGKTLGVDDGQGSLVCCSSWGHKESDTTGWLNWTELRKFRSHLKKLFSVKNFQPELQETHGVNFLTLSLS